MKNNWYVPFAAFVATVVTLTSEYYISARRIKLEIAHQEEMCQIKLDSQKRSYELKDKQRIESLEQRQAHLERMNELKDEKIELLEKLVSKYPK
jgi:hypothetical protein